MLKGVNLAQLLLSTPWTAIELRLLETYPSANAGVFARVDAHLRGLPPRPSPMRILLETVPDGAETRIIVTGCDGTLDDEASGSGNEARFSLFLEPWQHWLGMRVDASTIAAFCAPDILAHCLWTMTFDGSEELQIEPRVAWQRPREGEIKRTDDATLKRLRAELRTALGLGGKDGV
jgi:hypothetical protein